MELTVFVWTSYQSLNFTASHFSFDITGLQGAILTESTILLIKK